MLHRITVKNFYSFRDKTTIDFTVNKMTPITSKEIEGNFGVRLAKIKALFGPNASGKTTLLKVPAFIAWFIVRSFNRLERGDEIPVQPFLFGEEKDNPICIQIEFEIGKTFYRYTVELNSHMVFKEALWVREKKKLTLFFDRRWDEKKEEYLLKTISRLELPDNFEKFVRPNASVISTAAAFGNKEFTDLLDYFSRYHSNVTALGKSSNQFTSFKNNLSATINLLSKNEDLRKEVVGLLTKYDLGLIDVEINNNKKNGEDADVFGIHRTTDGKNEVKFPFIYESTGTQSLLVLVSRLLDGLRDQTGLIVFDEFEADLHPHVLQDLLSIIYSKHTNPNNTQLLISTHALTLLDDLGKNQIHLVEKDEEGTSHSWDLKKVKGVHKAENYFSKYFSGKYGAIPRIQ